MRPLLLLVSTLSLAACSAPDGRQQVTEALGLDSLRDYRGQQSGFQDTFYHARFLATPQEIEDVVQRLDLRPAGLNEMPETVPVERFVGPSATIDWWRPRQELGGGAAFSATRYSPDSTRIVSEVTLASQPATGVTYVEVFHP